MRAVPQLSLPESADAILIEGALQDCPHTLVLRSILRCVCSRHVLKLRASALCMRRARLAATLCRPSALRSAAARHAAKHLAVPKCISRIPQDCRRLCSSCWRSA